MKEEDRSYLDTGLDFMSEMLHQSPLTDKQKSGYWEVLKHYTKERVRQSFKTVYETFKPSRYEPFPIPATFRSVLADAPVENEKSHKCFCEACRKPGVFLHCTLCRKPQCFRCFSCEVHCRCEDGIQPFEESYLYRDLKTFGPVLSKVVKGGEEPINR